MSSNYANEAGIVQGEVGKQKVPAIVTVEWLMEHMKSDNIRIIDSTYHVASNRDAKAEYKEKHIPSAVFFDMNECADTSSEFDLPHMLPSSDIFEEYVASRGINNACHVIVYDNNAQVPVFSSQRLWWTFRCFGYDTVSVLEGGLQKWLSLGGSVTDEVTQPKKEIFRAVFRSGLVKAYDDIKDNIKSNTFLLIDARPPGRYEGTAPDPIPDVKSGHIPNTKNVPFGKLMNMENKTYKTAEELAQVFKDHSIDLNKPITFTCGSGLQASNLVLASYLCGKEDAALYDGSWVEWYRRAPPELKEKVPSDETSI